MKLLRTILVPLFLSFGTLPAQADEVWLELMLAIDVSGSIVQKEYDLQIKGIAAAFRAEPVIEAIAETGARGIAVSVMMWSGVGEHRVLVDWTHVRTRPEIEQLATTIETIDRPFAGNTALGAMIRTAIPLFADNGFEGNRRIIDVSGDGVRNEGPETKLMRDEAVAAGITLNGVPIGETDLDVFDYYRDHVIGGPGSFVMNARGFQEFPDVFRAKLEREIRGPVVATAPSHRRKG
ncbi:MAG: DUF1194 domain-containing protein [Rhodospirillaceae bacterium]|nr:DUF1194 domain-containing protein [Rhodospirillaceae bacterium]MBT6136795.1 DUF1194 domain-containing protein [Rhodospirillaceae bacterium]